MSGIHTAVLGERGRIAVPADLRTQHGFKKGASLVFVGSPWGLVITSREALLDRIQSELQGSSLLEDLLIDRRREAAIEDAR